MSDTPAEVRDHGGADRRASASGLLLDRLSIAFGAKDGLRDLRLHVCAGEHVALLGPSGVGKTSLLRAIAGLHDVGAGRVLLDGLDITALAPERRGVVYLHQTPALFPHLSVLDNVAFPLEVRGRSRVDARRAASSLLERVRLETFSMRRPAALSGGQRHRVALARALAATPRVLLLDEPFAALDPSLRADVRDAVFALLAEMSSTPHRTSSPPPVVMLVTHDIDEAVALTQRVVVLLDGRIAQDAPSQSVLVRPETLGIARFLGVPNLVPGERDAFGTVFSALGAIPSVGRAGSVWITSRSDALVAELCPADRVAGTDLDSANPLPASFVGACVAGTVRAALERMSGGTVQVSVGDATVLARRGRHALAAGDTVEVRVDVSRVHVIDADGADV